MRENPTVVRVDLHCHSWASDRPSLWLMQRLGCPESFVSPESVREVAMHRGMDFVTLTDHNTISGALEIAHYDNVIVGNEVTTYFPNDVKIHVLCLGLTPEQHDKINEVRGDIYEFVDYLNENNIVHVCAHPLHKVNGKLTWEHFEKLILLFKRFESLNGTRLYRLNKAVERVLMSLTPEIIEELSKKHGIEPRGDKPWIKYFTSGTDDHSGLFVGTVYTEIEVEEATVEGVLEGIRRGNTRPCGMSGGCLTLSHQVNSIAYRFYRSKIGPSSQELLQVLGRIFERKPVAVSSGGTFSKTVRKVLGFFRKPKGTGIHLIEEIREVIINNTSFKSLFEEGIMTREEFNHNVFSLSSDILDEMIDRVCRKPNLIPYFLFLAPVVTTSYIMCIKNLHNEKDLIETAEAWLGEEREPKVAWFTDSIVNMDGVSKTCRMFAGAAAARGKDLTLVACAPEDLEVDGKVKNFQPLRPFSLPGYEKVTLYMPSFLKVLKYIEDEDFDSIVVSTPGPMGLIGMLCGKLMKIPVHGIYHTDLPRIAMRVSGDPMFGEAALSLTKAFYRNVDGVFSPSRWYLDDLENLGIESGCTRILERWVDADDFNPSHRDEHYWGEPDKCKLLFVGRISEDKNLDLLIQLYQELEAKHPNFVINVVGDGPYYDKMRRKTAGFARFHMAGARFGEELRKAYASADLFVHPGLLDTFGNVVIEAQASGLPCVVMNEGGPQELVEPGGTGVVAVSERQFIAEVEKLIVNEQRRRDMSRKAARYAAERFAEDRIFAGFWKDVTGKPANGHAEFRFEQGSRANVVPLTA